MTGPGPLFRDYLPQYLPQEAPVTTPLPRPEPVLDAAKASAAVSLVVGGALTVLAALGVTVPDPEGVTRAVVAVATGLLTLVSIAATLLGARRARQKVTPLASPVSADGVPLVTDLPGEHAAPEA